MSDIILVIIAGLGGGILARLLKQPLILGYIVAGVVIGPHTTGATVRDVHGVEQLADIGVGLLLFSLGLEFSKKSIRAIAGIAIWGSLLQVLLTIVGGCCIVKYVLGWELTAALWFGLAIASSSTAVIMKTLVSRGNMNTLSGKLMMGMSIIQDMSLIPLMILLMQLGSEEAIVWKNLLIPIANALGFVLVMHVFGTYFAPRILRWVAKWDSRELFSLFIVAIGLGVGVISNELGLSFAFGAFVAGLVLCESDYGHKALSELIPLRDLFALLFFVSIGMLLDIRFLMSNIWTVLFLFAASAGLRGIILAATGWSFGYRRVIPIAMFFGMLAISEIAFVLIRMGLEAGALTQTQYSLILNMVAISMIIGPIANNLTTPVYNFFKKHNLHGENIKNRSISEDALSKHVIIIGDNAETILDVAKVLKRLSLPYIVVEPNHKEYRNFQHENINVIYGSPESMSILEDAGIARCHMLLLTLEDKAQRTLIIKTIHATHPNVQIVARAETIQEMKQLQDAKEISHVFHPDFEAALEISRELLLNLGMSPIEIQNYLARTRTELYDEHRKKLSEDEKLIKNLDDAANQLSSFWLTIPSGSPFAGKTLSQLAVRTNYGVSVTGVMRNNQFTPNPSSEFQLQEHDYLSVIGTSEQRHLLLEEIKRGCP